MSRLSTFSIVAYDEHKQEWGIAVQSKFLAVGAVVPWATANVGAVATQSYANTSFGPEGLALMAEGTSATEALDILLSKDEDRELRQVGLVDSLGGSASFTGSECHAWAGSISRTNFCVQGNILTGQGVVEDMAGAFELEKGELADRLVKALAAGQTAGGDSRGQQSAALLVVRERGGYAGFNDRYIDLRVDDNVAPIERLSALLDLHHLFFLPPTEEDKLYFDTISVRELQRILIWSGDYQGPITGDLDSRTEKALKALIGRENFEERVSYEEGWISRKVVDVLANKKQQTG
ncbi:MAG: DUF1028 domain-containing protein [Chloroflexota bacterium]